MALRDYQPLLFHVLLRLFTLVLGPIGFIVVMLELRLFFWPLLVGIYAGSYLLAERLYRKKEKRRRWKFWEPKPYPRKEGVHHLE